MKRLGDLFNSGRHNGIKMILNGRCELRDKGGAAEVIKTTGAVVEPDLELVFPLDFLADLAELAPAEKIQVNAISAKRPVLFESAGARVVIMPLAFP